MIEVESGLIIIMHHLY